MKKRQLLSRGFKALARSDAGAAAVELAVILPVLTLLAIGAADYGRSYFAGITVSHAARTGAQYGAQNTYYSGDFAGMNAAAIQDAGDVGAIRVSSSRFCRCPDSTTDVSCTTTCTDPQNPQIVEPETFVSVTTSKTLPFLLRYPGLPTGSTVTRTVILRVQ